MAGSIIRSLRDMFAIAKETAPESFAEFEDAASMAGAKIRDQNMQDSFVAFEPHDGGVQDVVIDEAKIRETRPIEGPFDAQIEAGSIRTNKAGFRNVLVMVGIGLTIILLIASLSRA